MTFEAEDVTCDEEGDVDWVARFAFDLLIRVEVVVAVAVAVAVLAEFDNRYWTGRWLGRRGCTDQGTFSKVGGRVCHRNHTRDSAG